MKDDEIVQIKVGRALVGIIGLRGTMEEVAGQYNGRPDSEVKAELIRRISKRNYVPEKAQEEYGDAVLREFKKFLGLPYEDVPVEGIEIKLLGPGCYQCDRLEQEILSVMDETGIIADMDHVRDPKEIGKYGVMGTPALVINGKVRSVGKVPPRSRLIELLKEASSRT